MIFFVSLSSFFYFCAAHEALNENVTECPGAKNFGPTLTKCWGRNRERADSQYFYGRFEREKSAKRSLEGARMNLPLAKWTPQGREGEKEKERERERERERRTRTNYGWAREREGERERERPYLSSSCTFACRPEWRRERGREGIRKKEWERVWEQPGLQMKVFSCERDVVVPRRKWERERKSEESERRWSPLRKKCEGMCVWDWERRERAQKVARKWERDTVSVRQTEGEKSNTLFFPFSLLVLQFVFNASLDRSICSSVCYEENKFLLFPQPGSRVLLTR